MLGSAWLDTSAMRERSKAEAERFGYELALDLPFLDDDLTLRSQGEVVDRCLALFVAVAVAYGFSRAEARAWSNGQGLATAFTPLERAFLDAEAASDAPVFGQSVEALWALMWSLGRVEDLDFGEPCNDDFVSLFPDVKAKEPVDAFIKATQLRSIDEIAGALDLSYCLHWAMVDLWLGRRHSPGRAEPSVVIPRRHALEWLLSRDEWDEVTLDT